MIINESKKLNESYEISSNIPLMYHWFLKSVVALTGQISYDDINKLGNDRRLQSKLRKIQRLKITWEDVMYEYDDDVLMDIGRKLKKIINESAQDCSTVKCNKLNEGNGVSSKIPAILDNFLQDVAQMTGQISYKDIIELGKDKKLSAKLDKIKKLKNSWGDVADDDNYDAMMDIGRKIKSIINESNKINESVVNSSKDKLYVLYSFTPESGMNANDALSKVFKFYAKNKNEANKLKDRWCRSHGCSPRNFYVSEDNGQHVNTEKLKIVDINKYID